MIRVDHVTKVFRGSVALRDLTFALDEGEVFGFVGPNGAGKTTTMKILAALLTPTSGCAVVDGIDVTARPEAVRERIGYMPDFFGVYDRLTASEYLAFYASCHRIPRARVGRVVADLLELVALGDRRDALVDTLSRGMKQRLCLARALVHDPRVLLLDEPASGLDPRARVEMRELVRELQAMGKTIVVSSHILPELAEMCTSFGIIDDGRMVASGPLGSLLGSAARRRARVQALGDLEQACLRAATIPGVLAASSREGALEVEYEGGEREAAQLLAALVGAGLEVVEFTSTQSDLEDIFLRVTRDRYSA